MSGTGHNDTSTHWAPEANKALERPTTPSAVAQPSQECDQLTTTKRALSRKVSSSDAVSKNSESAGISNVDDA